MIAWIKRQYHNYRRGKYARDQSWRYFGLCFWAAWDNDQKSARRFCDVSNRYYRIAYGKPPR